MSRSVSADPPLSKYEFGMMGACVVMIIAQSLLALRRLSRDDIAHSCTWMYVRLSRACRSICWRAVAEQRGDDDDGAFAEIIDEYVRRQVSSRQGKNMRAAVTGASCVACATAAIKMLQMLQRDMRASKAQDVTLIVGGATCIAGVAFPKRLVEGKDTFWYSWLMLILCAMIGLTTADDHMMVSLTSALLTSPRLALGVAYFRLPDVVFWNSVYVACTMYAYAVVPSGGASFWTTTAYRTLSSEALVVVQVVLLSSKCASAIRDELGQRATALMLRGESSAMRRLLELVCDVVVGLNTELEITEPAPRLGAMISMDPRRSMQGARLQDYMAADEDKTRFEQLLIAAQSDTEGALPGAMHTTFRDSSGSKLSAEVFYVKFTALDGRCRFLAGIQETENARALPIGELRPSAASASLDSEGDDSAPDNEDRVTQSVSSADSGAKQLMNPDFRRTSRHAQDVSLLGAMMTWNLSVRSISCCPFHLYLVEAHKVLSRLRSLQCKPHFRPQWMTQCEACGLFAPWDAEDAPPMGGKAPGLSCSGCGAFAVKRGRPCSL